MSATPAQDETPFKAPDFGQYRGRRLAAGALAAGVLVWGGLMLGRWTARPAPIVEAVAAPVPLEQKMVAVSKPPPPRRPKSARSAPVPPAVLAPRAAKTAAPRAPTPEAAPLEPEALAPWTAPSPPPPPPPAEPAAAVHPEPAAPAGPPPAEPVAPAAPAPGQAAPPPAEPEPSPTEAALLEPAFDGNGEAVARGIAAQKRSAIQQCFEQELKRTPALKGMVTVEMDLAPPHRVDDVRVVDDLGRPAFTQCVASTMQHVTFVALNEEVSVQMPFKLSARAK